MTCGRGRLLLLQTKINLNSTLFPMFNPNVVTNGTPNSSYPVPPTLFLYLPVYFCTTVVRNGRRLDWRSSISSVVSNGRSRGEKSESWTHSSILTKNVVRFRWDDVLNWFFPNWSTPTHITEVSSNPSNPTKSQFVWTLSEPVKTRKHWVEVESLNDPRVKVRPTGTRSQTPPKEFGRDLPDLKDGRGCLPYCTNSDPVGRPTVSFLGTDYTSTLSLKILLNELEVQRFRQCLSTHLGVDKKEEIRTSWIENPGLWEGTHSTEVVLRTINEHLKDPPTAPGGDRHDWPFVLPHFCRKLYPLPLDPLSGRRENFLSGCQIPTLGSKRILIHEV